MFGKNTNQEKKWKENIFPNFLTDNKKQANNSKQSGGQFLHRIFALFRKIRSQITAFERRRLILDLNTKNMESKTVNRQSAEKQT